MASEALSFQDAIRSRHSVRGFLPAPIPRNVLGEIFQEAQRAPSNCNTQPWNVHRDRHRPAGRAPSDGSRFLELQRSFAAAVPKVVVGKLAGSSGTPRGFNDAMAKIGNRLRCDA
jgi:hypothetical protein